MPRRRNSITEFVLGYNNKDEDEWAEDDYDEEEGENNSSNDSEESDSNSSSSCSSDKSDRESQNDPSEENNDSDEDVAQNGDTAMENLEAEDIEGDIEALGETWSDEEEEEEVEVEQPARKRRKLRARKSINYYIPELEEIPFDEIPDEESNPALEKEKFDKLLIDARFLLSLGHIALLTSLDSLKLVYSGVMTLLIDQENDDSSEQESEMPLKKDLENAIGLVVTEIWKEIHNVQVDFPDRSWTTELRQICLTPDGYEEHGERVIQILRDMDYLDRVYILGNEDLNSKDGEASDACNAG